MPDNVVEFLYDNGSILKGFHFIGSTAWSFTAAAATDGLAGIAFLFKTIVTLAVVKVVVALTVWFTLGVGRALEVAVISSSTSVLGLTNIAVFEEATVALAVVKVVVALTVWLALGVGRALEVAIVIPESAIVTNFDKARVALTIIEVVVALAIWLAL